MRQKHKALILAQCDAHVTSQLLSQESRDVQPMVSKITPDEYWASVRENSLYEKYDKLLRACYAASKQSLFKILPDNFGGFGFFYHGSELLKKSNTCPENVWALLENIDEEDEHLIEPISVFRPTDACRKARLMVGAVRFVNHSCVPNCEYIVSNIKGVKCIKLKIIKNLLPGDELFVFYGSDFFDAGNRNCKCPNTSFHEVAETGSQNAAFSRQRYSLIDSKLLTHVVRERRRFLLASTKKRRKVRPNLGEGRRYSSSSSSSLFNDSTDESWSSHDENDLEQTICAENKTTIIPEENQEDENSTMALEENENDENETMIPEGNEGDNQVNPFFSTPDNSETDAQLWFNMSNDLQDLSEILYVSNSNADEQKPDEGSSEDEAVDSGSLSNFVLCVFAIIAKHGTSDSEATDWVKLIQAVRPQIVVPSFRSMKKKFHMTEKEKANHVKKCGFGFRWQLDFVDELLSVITKHLKSIKKFDAKGNQESDLNLPQFFVTTSNLLNVFLILNSDGVKIMKSASKSIWPVWLAIANLPPKLRSSFENIVLASLWLGDNKPNWDSVFQASLNISFQQFFCYQSCVIVLVFRT